MRAVIAGFAVLLGVACTPGVGEYGACSDTADCQVRLYCVETDGILLNDAGNSYYDGGVCRRTCQTSEDCLNSELCGLNGYCSSDGGY